MTSDPGDGVRRRVICFADPMPKSCCSRWSYARWIPVRVSEHSWFAGPLSLEMHGQCGVLGEQRQAAQESVIERRQFRCAPHHHFSQGPLRGPERRCRRRPQQRSNPAPPARSCSPMKAATRTFLPRRSALFAKQRRSDTQFRECPSDGHVGTLPDCAQSFPSTSSTSAAPVLRTCRPM